MKPCDTPLCEGATVRARYCRPCYERRRLHTPERQAWIKRYNRKPRVREQKREGCADYRWAGKGDGQCSVCGGRTADKRAQRCVSCYMAQVLPAARRRGLAKIHGWDHA